ncbi:SDR family NAD(P)-dependent oxidoreductase [bacterium]|nr:SDR family NAD(P)-dependent oxidoreductase [bacterium]
MSLLSPVGLRLQYVRYSFTASPCIQLARGKQNPSTRVNRSTRSPPPLSTDLHTCSGTCLPIVSSPACLIYKEGEPPMAARLSDQTVIITGASRGIGRTIAKMCATEGARVAVTARNYDHLKSLADEINSEGGTAIPIAVDVTQRDQIGRMLTAVDEAFGPVDLMVNNAGTLNHVGPSWEADPDEWWQDIQINVYGLFLCNRMTIPPMLKAGKGRIINVTGGGAGSPFPFVSGYATGKAAVVRFTENLAEELDRAGEEAIKVFSISPGFVRTDMTETFINTEKGRKWMDYMAERLNTNQDISPTHAAELVIRIGTGVLDAYHGRYLHAGKDAAILDDLPEQGTETVMNDYRVLRFTKPS